MPEPGFGPAAEALLFRQKDPKPYCPWCGPSRFLRGSPTPVARKLAGLGLSILEGLKQCAPFPRSRLHCSATPQGQERRRYYCPTEFSITDDEEDINVPWKVLDFILSKQK